MKYDVVVVGAGPAGNIAAKTLAEKGANVLVVERKQEIGPPKRCAEGITRETLDELGIKPHSAWAVNKIDGGIVYSPKGREIEILLKGQTGFILERKIFEKYLAVEAIKAGARYMVKARADAVTKEDGAVTGVVVNHMGVEKKISANIVIAADGVDSKIARSAGLPTTNRMTDYHSGFQYEMASVACKENMLHFFFGEKIAPKGYAWIFPKGNTLANVGLGIMGVHSKDGARAKDYLDRFIEENPRFFKNASYVEVNAGGIPVSGGVKEIAGDGIMLVGDAAQHVHPLTGGGMTFGMLGAKMAAEVAAEAVSKGDYSKETLSSYERQWSMKYGRKMEKLLKARHLLEKLTDDELEKLSSIFTSEEIFKITSGEMSSLYPTLLKKAPQMVFLLKKLVT